MVMPQEGVRVRLFTFSAHDEESPLEDYSKYQKFVWYLTILTIFLPAAIMQRGTWILVHLTGLKYSILHT